MKQTKKPTMDTNKNDCFKRPYIAQSKESLAYAIIHDPLEFPSNAYETVSKECIDVIRGVSYYIYIYIYMHNIHICM
jgi:hypothetical protein